MSQLSLPVNRPMGRVMLVASPQAAARPTRILTDLGYGYSVMDDPYAAMVELCRRPLAYQALILWLGSVYREELSVIRSVKRRFPNIEIWLADTDHHAAALAEAMRQGADGLLDEEGLHRAAAPPPFYEAGVEILHSTGHKRRPPPAPSIAPPPEPAAPAPSGGDEEHEPILSAEELRALLRGSE